MDITKIAVASKNVDIFNILCSELEITILYENKINDLLSLISVQFSRPNQLYSLGYQLGQYKIQLNLN